MSIRSLRAVPPPAPAYAELHCHSAFSLLDGAALPEALAARAHALGYPALALTDHDELGGVVRFAEATRTVGIGGIVGLELTVDVPDARLQGAASSPPEPPRRTHLVLLAQTREGYGNLAWLVTRARMDRPRGAPAVSFDLLAQHTAGVFALTGCPRGWVPQLAREGRMREARRALGLLADCFGDRLAVEVWDHGLPEERKLVRRLLPLAHALGVPWVVTNNAHYAEPSGRVVHDVLSALRHERALDDMGTRLRPNGEWYLKSAAQLAATWRGHEQGLAQSLAIAERCAFRLDQLRPSLPTFPLPPGVSDSTYLTQLVEQGATERWGAPGTARRTPKHEAQLAHELALITKLGLAGYFLIVWDIVRFARRAGILCQGRGSAANSAVCYCLGITAIDPIRMELLFERFLSEEREEPPDIDIDFAHRDRERVLQYVYERYGREHAAMVCEQITYRGRSATRDVARVLGFSVQQGEALASLADRFSARATAESLRITHEPDGDAAEPVADDGAAHRLAPDPRRATADHPSQHAPDLRDETIARAALRVNPDLRDIARAALKVNTYHWREPTPENRAKTPDGDGVLPSDKRDALKRQLKLESQPANPYAPDHASTMGPAGGPSARHVLAARLGQQMIGGTEAVRHANAVDDEARKVREAMGGRLENLRMAEAHLRREQLAAIRETPDVVEPPAPPPVEPTGPARNALLESVGLDPADPRVQVLADVIDGLHQLPRHRSIHVGGFVLTREPLGTVVPIEPASMPGRTVIQWEKDDLDPVGLVKIDLLGLGMLTVVQDCLLYLRHTRGVQVDLAQLDMSDQAVYDQLCAADSVGVFQVESRAQMNTLPRLKPRCFYDLVVEVALIRPGPIQGDMVHPYLRRRAGLEPITYPHPAVEHVLKRTLGVPLFQEQGMQVAIAAAGFTPGQADVLRRAMGHKRSRERMADICEQLIAGMQRNGIPEDIARRIYNQINAFADYGFPESHAASFALIVYATAYLRHYYGAEYLCAMLNAQPMGFYSPSTLVEDAKRHGVEVRGIDLTKSAWDHTLELADGRTLVPNDGTVAWRGAADASCAAGRPPVVRLGLRLIRGLGHRARAALEAALAHGPFTSVHDFVARVSLDRASVQRIAESGAFDALFAHEPEARRRRVALWEVLQAQRGEAGPLAPMTPRVAPPAVPALSAVELTASDFRMTGLSLAGHPMVHVRDALALNGVQSARDLLERGRDGDRIGTAGLVICRQRPGTAKGFVFLTLEDETGMINIVVTPKRFERDAQIISGSPLLLVRGILQVEGRVVNVRARTFRALRAESGEGFVKGRDYR
jgi:DNA polymerase III alpha subunit